MRIAAAVVLLAILAPALNTFITATVLPSVVADIGGLALYAWATIAYAVASIVGSAASSAIARRLGLRLAFVVASAGFVIGSVVCATAPAMSVIVTGRSIQGLGGGMTIAVVHAMIRALFPEHRWPRMLATVSVAWGVAAVAGPFVGGVLAQLGLWRASFWATIPLVAITCAIAWRLLPPRQRTAGLDERLPFGRLLLICTAVLCLASVANTPGAGARGLLVSAMAVTLTCALVLDGRARIRLFPSGMLSFSRPVGKCFWIIFLLAVAGSPSSVYLPLLAQMLHGIGPAGAGYFYAGQSLAWTAAAVITARVASHQVRTAIVLGPVVMAAGLGGLFFFIARGPVAVIAVSIALAGVGVGTCWAHVGNVVLGAARRDEEEATAALIPSTQLFAIAFGSALCGIVANAAGLSREASADAAAATGHALYGGAALAALAAAAVAWQLAPARAR
jgi:predicted MFS family arabinose efflux permease